MAKFLFALCIVAVLGSSKASVITSEPVTDWGDWAIDFERCPPGLCVQGFQVLSETELTVDTTCMNGLKLFCGNPETGGTPAITSAVGKWGEWSQTKWRCSGQGYVTGFQLKVEKPGVVQDETATNNIRIFCDTNEQPIEGDGQIYGQWGDEHHCPDGQVVCGLRTQVEKDQGNLFDDTALNNISMECCPHPASYNVSSYLLKN